MDAVIQEQDADQAMVDGVATKMTDPSELYEIPGIEDEVPIIFPLPVETISEKGEMLKLLLDSIDLAIENPSLNMVPPGVDARYFGRKVKETYHNHFLSYL